MLGMLIVFTIAFFGFVSGIMFLLDTLPTAYQLELRRRRRVERRAYMKREHGYVRDSQVWHDYRCGKINRTQLEFYLSKLR